MIRRIEAIANLSNDDRQLVVLLGVALFFAIGYTGALVVVPLLASEVHAPASQVGLVVAVPGAVAVVLAIPSASMSNRFGRAAMVRAGFLCLVLAPLGYLSAPDFLWLIPSQVALGLSVVLFWPSALTAFSETTRQRSHEAVQGANAVVQGAASFIAAVTVGLLATTVGLDMTLGVLAALAGAGFGFATLVRESRPLSALTDDMGLRTTFQTTMRLLATEPYVAMGAYALVSWSILWWVAGTSFFILHVRDAGHSAAFGGALLGVRIGIASLVRLRFAAIAGRLSLPSLLIGGNILAAAGLIVAVLSEEGAALLASALVQGLGLALVLPASNVVISRGTVPADRVVGLATSVMFNNLAILLAAPILGLAAALGGTSAALVTAAAIATALSLALLPWRSTDPHL